MGIPAQSPQVQTPTEERRDILGRIEAVLLVVGITLLSLNQRPALVAVGPVTEQIRHDTGLSASATSLLTTLPLICLGVFAALAPAFARTFGLDRAIGAALITLALGIVVRVIPTVTALFVGSVVAGIGIAVMNVLVPALVKRDFSDRIGLMTAVYTLMLNGGAGLAAAFTIPVSHSLHLDWRAMLQSALEARPDLPAPNAPAAPRSCGRATLWSSRTPSCRSTIPKGARTRRIARVSRVPLEPSQSRGPTDAVHQARRNPGSRKRFRLLAPVPTTPAASGRLGESPFDRARGRALSPRLYSAIPAR